MFDPRVLFLWLCIGSDGRILFGLVNCALFYLIVQQT